MQWKSGKRNLSANTGLSVPACPEGGPVTVPLADYYIIAGVVYQAPDLGSVIGSRVVRVHTHTHRLTHARTHACAHTHTYLYKHAHEHKHTRIHTHP